VKYPAQTGANPVVDPYAGTLTHASFLADMATALPCRLNPQGTSYTNANVTPGCIIAGGWTLKGGTFDLLPGSYWITDGDLQLGPGGGSTTLDCPTCTAGGAGVTITLTTQKTSGGTDGTVVLRSQANLNLIAPSTGPFAGMVLIQVRERRAGGRYNRFELQDAGKRQRARVPVRPRLFSRFNA
jgi:hypothetical protein